MAVLKMQKISICGLKKERKQILEALQKTGAVEVQKPQKQDDVFKTQNTSSERTQFDKISKTMEKALEVLDRYSEEKKSMFASLEGKKTVSRKTLEELDEKAVRDRANRIIELDALINESKASIQKSADRIVALAPFMVLDVKPSIDKTEKTAIFIGSCPNPCDYNKIYSAVFDAVGGVESFQIEVVSSDKDMTVFGAVCMKKDEKAVFSALRSIGFSKPTADNDEVPKKRKAELEEKIKKLLNNIESYKKEISDNQAVKEDLQIICDRYTIRADKYEVLGEVMQSKNTFIISGYVAEKNGDRIKQMLEKKFTAFAELSEPDDNDDVPVLLKNNHFSQSTEGVLASFGLPKKGEIDPTTIMSFFYVFLFGLMLSDAAYGFIITLACFIVTQKFKNMNEGLNKSLRMFMYSGLSTCFWGVMFGSYFGDAPAVIAKTFFGYTGTALSTENLALWFVPLDEPMRMLIYCMIFGLIHLFTGLILSGYTMLKNKQYMDCLVGVGFWFAFLIGLLLMLIPSSLFASIAGKTIVFPHFLNIAAKVMAIGGALGILLMSGRRKKNIGLRLALGAYDLYNTTSWLSDVLSYSRLLALGLATGVIASVVNQMGSMKGNTVVGVIMFIVVFLIGHTFNIAINLLGAYVHTNRLQYVEFFGKFYEGGGREFVPFKENTKYVNTQEEK